jgi:uncharacterized protein (DUF934 family)
LLQLSWSKHETCLKIGTDNRQTFVPQNAVNDAHAEERRRSVAPRISEWHPKYDWTENDEDEYQKLVAAVSREIASAGTVSKSTFLRIWNWKGAMRVIGHVLLDAYDTLYAPAFRRAASEPAERKLAALALLNCRLPR